MRGGSLAALKIPLALASRRRKAKRSRAMVGARPLPRQTHRVGLVGRDRSAKGMFSRQASELADELAGVGV